MENFSRFQLIFLLFSSLSFIAISAIIKKKTVWDLQLPFELRLTANGTRKT